LTTSIPEESNRELMNDYIIELLVWRS
jgi:hypothetical protein